MAENHTSTTRKRPTNPTVVKLIKPQEPEPKPVEPSVEEDEESSSEQSEEAVVASSNCWNKLCKLLKFY
jgi:hypothetical protein